MSSVVCGLQQHAVEYAAEKILLLKKFIGAHERWNVLSTAEIESTLELESIQSLFSDPGPRSDDKDVILASPQRVHTAPATPATQTNIKKSEKKREKKREEKPKSRMCTIM